MPSEGFPIDSCAPHMTDERQLSWKLVLLISPHMKILTVKNVAQTIKRVAFEQLHIHIYKKTIDTVFQFTLCRVIKKRQVKDVTSFVC